LNILLPTDAFPPRCGGSGWSSYELARALRARGHRLSLVQPRPGQGAGGEREYDGFRVREIAAAAPDVPFVRNYFKNERLTRTLTPILDEEIRRGAIDIVHAQHVLTAPAAIAAANAAGVPVVCTVRDYWPVCYWSDLIHDPSADGLCPACTTGAMRTCIRPRAGAAWPLALPLIPYMAANLERKRAALACADAIVAVSSTIAADLRARAPELARSRIEVIPNPVNLDALTAAVEDTTPPLEEPYVVYVGKLAPNKGVDRLLAALRDAPLSWTVALVGDGPDRAVLERAAADLRTRVVFTGWVERDEALRWMRHASLLAFPSHGPESLSRVLIEASALGVPIAAMDTGGTRDIVVHGETGLLSSSVSGFAADLRRLVDDRPLAARLAAGARARARGFDAASVAERIDRLYADLTRARSRARA
jgi:glycogen synthase